MKKGIQARDGVYTPQRAGLMTIFLSLSSQFCYMEMKLVSVITWPVFRGRALSGVLRIFWKSAGDSRRSLLVRFSWPLIMEEDRRRSHKKQYDNDGVVHPDPRPER